MTGPEADIRTASRIGFWAAVLTAAWTVLFTVAAVLTEAGRLAAPWDVVLPIVPSLLLAPSVLVLLVCVHAVVAPDRRIWSQLAVAFAVVYVSLSSASYVVELAVVEPRVLRGAASDVALLTLVRGDSVFNAIDGLGYLFLCLAALFAAPAFGGDPLQRWIRWLLLATGALAVPIFLTYFVDRAFIYGAALWSVTLSGLGILMARHFRRLGKDTRTRDRGSV